MNRIILLVSVIASILFFHFGLSMRVQINTLRSDEAELQMKNLEMQKNIKDRKSLVKEPPVRMAVAYAFVLNQIKLLENFSGTSMNIELEGGMGSTDIASHYETTAYKGVKGLRIRMVVDKFSKETDMGAVLDDIHQLEKNTDFVSTQISKDNNNLIVKGEIYGI